MSNSVSSFSDPHTNEKYTHNGIIELNKGKDICWREKAGGEIVFALTPSSQYESLAHLSLTDEERLTLVNKILAYYRPHAIPDGNGFYASSIGITKEGLLFVAVNNEKTIKEPFAGRNCAESKVLDRAQTTLQNADVEFSEIYLMSGMAKKNGQNLVDKTPGNIATCCGECRVNLRNHTRGGKFIMVPANDGSLEVRLSPSAKAAADLKTGEAWQIDYETMYPLPTHVNIPEQYNPHVRKGYEYIFNTSAPLHDLPNHLLDTIKSADKNKLRQITSEELEMLTRPSLEIRQLRNNSSIDNINKTLLNLIKEAYNLHAGKTSDAKNIDITAIVLKTADNKFFPGILVNGSLWLPTKPPAAATALSNTGNNTNITEMYMMHFNEHQATDEMRNWNNGIRKGHALHMPDPAALGRLIKNTPAGDAKVTVIPINSGDKNAEQALNAMAVTIGAQEMFGPLFSNPKRINSIGIRH